MAPQSDLIEFYRQHREEVEILADERSLFVLTLIQQLRPNDLKDLAQHLDWDSDELVTICTKLQNAGMIDITDLHDPTADIKVSHSGIDLLETFYSQFGTDHGISLIGRHLRERYKNRTKEQLIDELVGLHHRRSAAAILPDRNQELPELEEVSHQIKLAEDMEFTIPSGTEAVIRTPPYWNIGCTISKGKVTLKKGPLYTVIDASDHSIKLRFAREQRGGKIEYQLILTLLD